MSIIKKLTDEDFKRIHEEVRRDIEQNKLGENISEFEEETRRVNELIEEHRKSVPLQKRENYFAKLLAVSVRNAMEKFHIKYLSDEQMKELNPIIRNAIYTALVNINNDMSSIAFYEQYIPPYWEDCELL